MTETHLPSMEAPVTTITTFPEKRTKPARAASLVFGIPAGEPTDYWFAAVETENGQTLHVSKRVGTADWYIDAAYGRSGLPIFVNGLGSVCSRKLADRELAGILNANVGFAATKGAA